MIKRLSDGMVLRVTDGPQGGAVHYLRGGNWHVRGHSNVQGGPTAIADNLEAAARRGERRRLILDLRTPAEPYTLPQLRMDNAISADHDCPACRAVRRIEELRSSIIAQDRKPSAKERTEMESLLKIAING